MILALVLCPMKLNAQSDSTFTPHSANKAHYGIELWLCCERGREQHFLDQEKSICAFVDSNRFLPRLSAFLRDLRNEADDYKQSAFQSTAAIAMQFT